MDKVMPPKKSKAARKTASVDDSEADASGGGDELKVAGKSKKGGQQNGHVADDEGESSGGEEVNIFKQSIVEGKRKRFAPVAEQTLTDWLKKNFVAKEDNNLSGSDMYEAYLEMCSSAATYGVDIVHFHKAVKEMFPNGLELVADSPYKETIKVKKEKKKSTKVQADSLQIKMRDIIKEAIVDLGNIRKGIRFSSIKTHIASKYPALRVDIREHFLKNAVFRELRYGHIDCVRGVGACGYYRLPRTPEEEEREEEEEKAAEEKIKKEKEAKLAVKKEASGEDAAAGIEKTETEDGAVADGGETSSKKKDKKGKKSKKTDTAAGGTEADGTDTKTDEAAAGDGEKKKKKKKSKKKKSKRDEAFLVHSQPQRIEDVFPLAMTYNSEPKESSVAKIRKYITDHYDSNLHIDKLKKCLESGADRGYWAQVSGHGGGSGSFQLTINEFDPTADDDLTGMIMNAIVACTEPKTCSALLLKKYVLDYHPGFKVAERPHLFKKALERATAKNILVQLSGIGSTGSFQLVSSFSPNPTVLQGNDTVDDYPEDASDAEVGGESFRDAYVPRPTKRGGHGRTHATKVSRLDPSLPNPKPTHSKPGNRKPKDKRKPVKTKYTEVSSDQDSDDEPTKKKKKNTPSKNKNKQSSSSRDRKTVRTLPTVKSYPVDSDSDVGSEPEYTPRKSTSRGGRPTTPAARKAPPTKKTAKGKKMAVAKKASMGKSPKKAAVDESDDESQSEVEIISPPKSHGKVSASQVKGRVAPTKRGGASSDESDDELPQKKRPGKSPSSSRGRATKHEPDSDDDSDKEKYVPKLTLSRSSDSKVKVTPNKRAARPPSDSDESEPEVKKPAARGGSRGGSKGRAVVQPESDDFSEDEKPKMAAGKKKTPAKKGGKKSKKRK